MNSIEAPTFEAPVIDQESTLRSAGRAALRNLRKPIALIGATAAFAAPAGIFAETAGAQMTQDPNGPIDWTQPPPSNVHTADQCPSGAVEFAGQCIDDRDIYDCQLSETVSGIETRTGINSYEAIPHEEAKYKNGKITATLGFHRMAMVFGRGGSPCTLATSTTTQLEVLAQPQHSHKKSEAASLLIPPDTSTAPATNHVLYHDYNLRVSSKFKNDKLYVSVQRTSEIKPGLNDVPVNTPDGFFGPISPKTGKKVIKPVSVK